MAGTPFSATFLGEAYNVGGDTDTWGDKTKTYFDQVQADITALGASAATSLKGNNTGSSGGVRDLTGAEATALLSAFTGDSGSGGVKGVVPAPAAGDERKVLAGNGAWSRGVGRFAGCVISTTSVNGSQPTISGGWNVASVSTVTNGSGTLASVTLTYTDAAADANYSVQVTPSDPNVAGVGYDSKATGSVVIYWKPTGSLELSVSIF